MQEIFKKFELIKVTKNHCEDRNDIIIESNGFTLGALLILVGILPMNFVIMLYFMPTFVYLSLFVLGLVGIFKNNINDSFMEAWNNIKNFDQHDIVGNGALLKEEPDNEEQSEEGEDHTEPENSEHESIKKHESEHSEQGDSESGDLAEQPRPATEQERVPEGEEKEQEGNSESGSEKKKMFITSRYGKFLQGPYYFKRVK